MPVQASGWQYVMSPHGPRAFGHKDLITLCSHGLAQVAESRNMVRVSQRRLNDPASVDDQAIVAELGHSAKTGLVNDSFVEVPYKIHHMDFFVWLGFDSLTSSQLFRTWEEYLGAKIAKEPNIFDIATLHVKSSPAFRPGTMASWTVSLHLLGFDAWVMKDVRQEHPQETSKEAMREILLQMLEERRDWLIGISEQSYERMRQNTKGQSMCPSNCRGSCGANGGRTYPGSHACNDAVIGKKRKTARDDLS
ncbi:MAG: hypothetical protein M1828_002179 [Chrysothrix sp. TS-e1954]|nr:MAG: hypothetical protein M1828_002179 [Chrysothrix sp. TS-e1954]